MSFSERKDLGIRVAGDKARKADEFLTRSQLVPGNNIYFDYLANWDIRINALTGGGGVATQAGLRNMIAYIVVATVPKTVKRHLYLNSTLTGDAPSSKRFFGTLLFQDVYHLWNLPSKDHFIYSVEDLTSGASPAPANIDSLPEVVGVDGNRLRIWATTPGEHAAFAPTNWVDVDESNNMKNTRFLHPSAYGSSIEGVPSVFMFNPRMYKITITEIDDPSVNTRQDLVQSEVEV